MTGGGLLTPIISIQIHTSPWLCKGDSLRFWRRERACQLRHCGSHSGCTRLGTSSGVASTRSGSRRTIVACSVRAAFMQAAVIPTPYGFVAAAPLRKPIRFQRVRISAHSQPRLSVQWFNAMCHVRGQHSRGYVHGPSEPRLCNIGVIARIKTYTLTDSSRRATLVKS
jgi:hypothetical protein